MNAKREVGFIAMVAVAGYIFAQMLADISSIKIAVLFGLAIDAGTFVYPFTFTLRDLVHKSWGKELARKLIVTAGLINLAMAVFFQFVISLPADASWGLQSEFETILGPIWRIVIASILAEIISEIIDTEAYSFFKNKITSRFQWLRVLFSNSLALPIDSIIFSFVAFYGDLPIEVVWAIVVSNILVKGSITLLSLPTIYLVKEDRD